MDRLIAANTVIESDADRAPTTGTPGFATNGNPALGRPRTAWPAYAWNMVCEEVRAVIVAAGLTPSSTNWGQLLEAIEILSEVPPLGFTPVRQGTGARQSATNVVRLGLTTTTSKLAATIDATDFGDVAFEAWVEANFISNTEISAYAPLGYVDSNFKRLGNDFSNNSGITSTRNFVVPAGVTRIRFRIVGGGGAGGAGLAGTYSGGGGGSGGHVEGVAAVTPGQVILVTIGAGGVPAGSGATAGAGGDTYFGSFARAGGGGGGGSNSPFSAGGRGGTSEALGGVAAMPCNGNDGTDGMAADVVTALSGLVLFGGDGGGSIFGGGARAGSAGGLDAASYGGGGGGTYNGTAIGGDGFAGLCFLEF